MAAQDHRLDALSSTSLSPAEPFGTQRTYDPGVYLHIVVDGEGDDFRSQMRRTIARRLRFSTNRFLCRRARSLNLQIHRFIGELDLWAIIFLGRCMILIATVARRRQSSSRSHAAI